MVNSVGQGPLFQLFVTWSLQKTENTSYANMAFSKDRKAKGSISTDLKGLQTGFQYSQANTWKQMADQLFKPPF